MHELYVYYRVGRADAASTLPQIEHLLDGLRRSHAGLRARLLRRAQGGVGEEETWMEVYTHPGGITTGLQAAIEAAARGVAGARLGQRRVEVFEPLTSTGAC